TTASSGIRLVVDHCANGFAVVHEAERFIDVFQSQRMRDERSEVDLARHGVFHHSGQLGAALHAAEGRPKPAAAGHQLEWAGGDFLTGAGHADDHGLTPAAVRALQGGTHNVDVTDALKGVVDPPAGHL